MKEQFKQAMSYFATGICVITYKHPDNGHFEGITISAFSSLSLVPLKILFCLGNRGVANKQFSSVSQFAVNILDSGQKDLAYQCAGTDYTGLEKDIIMLYTVPVIKGTLATVICDKGNSYCEGDHDIIIGNVNYIELGDKARQPLLYHKSEIIEDYQHV
ncbi:MAG: flavin reductase family protein [Ostreibacterium sp.]